MNPTRLFRVKKIVNICLAIFSTCGCVFMAVTVLADDEFAVKAKDLEEKFSIHSKDLETAKKIGIIFISIYYGIFALCGLFGIIGTFLENFRMVTAYMFQELAMLVINLIYTCFNPYWGNYGATVYSFLVSAFVLYFLRDLYLVKQARRKQKEEEMCPQRFPDFVDER